MSIYLKKFSTHAEYETYIASEDNVLPNVSICTTEGDVHYNPVPPHDYSQDYFTMVVTNGGGIKFSGSTTANTLSYSKDNGDNWTTANSSTTISVVEGDKVLWKGTPTPVNGIGKFSGDTNVRYSVEGNVMSLLFGGDFKGQTSLEGKDSALRSLFFDNTNVTSAENLSLPATTLADYCYQSMFFRCTSLTTAPELPATTLADNCYVQMFYGCTSLTTAPKLPATTLTTYCYHQMFNGCTSLTTAPKLPATKMTDYCYNSMFEGCTSLTTAPKLPATTLALQCYGDMFYDCTNLTSAPSILPATTLADGCYSYMFYGCTSLTTAPELPATSLTQSCYSYMFQNCTSLSSIKCLATNISARYCTTNWVYGVSASGTFIKAASMSRWSTGVPNGIPDGWTVQDA